MNTDNIKKQIEAFYNGETTPEEEQILFGYFSGEDVAEELLDEKELFLKMYEADSPDVPPMLASKLNHLIDELALNEKDEVIQSQQSKRKLWLWAGSAAAGIALLVSVGISFNDKPTIIDTQTATITAEDQQKIKEAQEALLLLSSNFNKGMDQLAVVSQNLDKTNDILTKTLKRKNEEES